MLARSIKAHPPGVNEDGGDAEAQEGAWADLDLCYFYFKRIGVTRHMLGPCDGDLSDGLMHLVRRRQSAAGVLILIGS